MERGLDNLKIAADGQWSPLVYIWTIHRDDMELRAPRRHFLRQSGMSPNVEKKKHPGNGGGVGLVEVRTTSERKD